MSDAARMIEEFHRVLDQEPGHGKLGGDNELRIRLHGEEHWELVDELRAHNLPGIAQELADVLYVAYGTAYTLGIPIDAVLAAVHAANMAKFEGGVQRRADGKVAKPEGWEPPDIKAVLDARPSGGWSGDTS